MFDFIFNNLTSFEVTCLFIILLILVGLLGQFIETKKGTTKRTAKPTGAKK